jgi:hypothetical protein
MLTTIVNDLGLCFCMFLVGSGDHDFFVLFLAFLLGIDFVSTRRSDLNKNVKCTIPRFRKSQLKGTLLGSVIACTPGHSLWEYIFVSNARIEQDGLADNVESYQILPTRDPEGVTRPLFKKLFLSQNGKQPVGPDEI